jgi:hypothetical protein
VGEGWLSLLKWLPPLDLSNMGLFKDSDVVLSDYSLPRQHLHQGVPPELCLYNSYIRGCPHEILLCPPSTLPVGNSLWQMEHLWTLLAVVPSEDATVDDVAGSQSSATCGGVAEIGTGASIRGAGCLTWWLVLWPPCN